MALQVLHERAEAHHVLDGLVRAGERVADCVHARPFVERAPLAQPPALLRERETPRALGLVVCRTPEAVEVPVDLAPREPEEEGRPHQREVEGDAATA